jgi:diguanylate cyclase (GGDEF)-like protein/PAS domain S-box-containing protein
VSTSNVGEYDQVRRTQLERDLRQQVANLSAVLENTQDAVWSIDPSYTITTLNLVFRQQFLAAYGQEVKVGMNHLDCLPVAERDRWRSYYDQALRGDRVVAEFQNTMAGLPEHVEMSFNPILTPSCQVVGVAVFSRNVSDRKQAELAMLQAKEQLRAVLDAVPGCVSWFSSDLTYLGINRYLAATFQLDADAFVGRQLGFMASSPGFSEFVRRFFQSSLQESKVEIVATVEGQPRHYLVVAQKYQQGDAAVFVGIDITERKRVEEALLESQERYALAVRGANDGLWDWNLKTSTIYFSPRWKAMLGYQEPEIGNTPDEWLNRVHPEEVDWLKAQLAAHLEGRSPSFEVEHRMRHRDGSYRWMLSRGLAVRDEHQVAYRMAGSQTDITERKRAEEQLLHDALHDSLTGLFNRALFMDRLSHAIDQTKRQSSYLFAVLFLDLDGFKMINDSLGHIRGDELLVAIARRLEGCLRPGDTLARLGGDEFTILLENIQDLSAATRVADTIHQQLQQPFSLGGQEVFTTVSIGIALSDTGCDRPDELLRNADTAMYRAKALGRARHEIFNVEMYDRVVARLKLETDLRLTLASRTPMASTLAASETVQDFQMRYQPIVSLTTGRIIGFEALVRWQHPTRGLVSPSEFIPVAEETGLIAQIGHWTLRESCRQLKVWQLQFGDPTLSMSVNLSSRQFSAQDLLEQVQQAIADFQLDARTLKLEITESAVMEDAQLAKATLQQLKHLQTQLLIDDFGTGYSSLSYLHQFPIDTVKIDQSFVRCIGMENDGEAIVRAIVGLAHNLGMTVIAEGIEAVQQMDCLCHLQAEYGQGYYFAKPLTAADATALLAAHPCWRSQPSVDLEVTPHSIMAHPLSDRPSA